MGVHSSGTPRPSAAIVVPRPACVITSAADGRISACGTYRTTCVLPAAVTDAGSIDGPVVTMARTGSCPTASTHRCSRSAWPCSLVLRLTRTSGVDPSPRSTPSISWDSGGASSTGPVRSTLAASGTSGSNSFGSATIAHAQASWMSPRLSTAGRPSSARCAFAIAMPGANISTSGPPRKIVYGVWNSVAVGVPEASATSIAVNSMQSTSTASAGSRSSSRATSRAMTELKLSSSISSFTSASKSSGSSIASQSAPWLNGTKRVPTSPHRSSDRAVPEHPDVVAALDERAGDPQRRREVPRAVPGDDQVAAHRAPLLGSAAT